MKSTPLLMKWPLSLRVDGSSPKVRAMEPRSSLCSSHTTNHAAFDTKGQNSLTLLCLLLIPFSLSLSLSLSLSVFVCGETLRQLSCLTISGDSVYCAMVLTASGMVSLYSPELVTTYIIIIIINFLLLKKKKKKKNQKNKNENKITRRNQSFIRKVKSKTNFSILIYIIYNL